MMSKLIEILWAFEAGETVLVVPLLGPPAAELSTKPVSLNTESDIALAYSLWLKCTPGHHEPYVKPTLTPVDLSVLIDSGIDCGFIDHKGGKYLSRLVKVDQYYWSDPELYGHGGEAECRPRTGHWHSLRNGCADEITDLKLIDALHTAGFRVSHHPEERAIRFGVDPTEGYCWPWELDA